MARGFDLEEATAHLAKRDRALGKWMKRIGPLEMDGWRKPFDTVDALSRSILYQQLSGKAAATIVSRTFFGGALLDVVACATPAVTAFLTGAAATLSATARATARVPASKRGSSNTPIGPFHRMVRASPITSPNSWYSAKP